MKNELKIILENFGQTYYFLHRKYADGYINGDELDNLLNDNYEKTYFLIKGLIIKKLLTF